MNEQLKMDLANLSRTKLFKIAGEKDIELKKSISKDKIIDRLFEEIDPDELEDISKDYIYAGRTSLSIWKYTPEENTENRIEKGNLPEILKFMCDGENPFEINRRPDINETPQMISAKMLDDSICRIQFVSLGRVKKVREGYVLRIIPDTIFIDALLNLDNRTLEVRTEYRLLLKPLKHFLNI